MCGISLIYSPDGNPNAGKGIGEMNAALAHRGPDGSATLQVGFGTQRLWLGHTRLQILGDFDHGSQPMMADDGRFIMLYNGEVYNYLELAEEENIADKTTDTDVVFALICKYGKDALLRFNGMFAIVFADTVERKVWLARDRHGIKSLFYSKLENIISVSSELMPLIGEHMCIKADQVGHYLKYKYPEQEKSLVAEVKEVPAGCTMEITGPELKPTPFYQAIKEKTAASQNKESIVDEVESLLRKALDRHLIADVPVGLFLSGGIDSTLLLSLWSDKRNEVKTFSVAYEEKGKLSADGDSARIAAKTFNAEHQELLVTPQSLSQAFFEMLSTLDRPIGDGALCLTYMLSAEARKQVKVALTGAGADELFGGYRRHQAIALYLKHLKDRPTTVALLKNLYGAVRKTGLSPKVLQQVIPALTQSAGKTFQNFTALSSDVVDNLSAVPQIETLQDALRYDRQNYLIGDVLALNDIAGMIHGLEIRTPYLDNELVAYVSTLNSVDLQGSSPKWILKEILKRNGGKGFVDRKKAGFGIPFGRWMANGQLPEIELLMKKYDGPKHEQLKPLAVDLLRRNQKYDLSQELWAMAILMGWIKKTPI